MDDGFGGVLEAARAGDRGAWDHLYRTYQPLLARYVAAMAGGDTQDVCQEAWLSAARSIHRFQGGPSEFRAWLCTIARRRHVDGHRRAKVRLAAIEATAPATACPSAEREALGRHDYRTVVAALSTLPPDQAEAVLLRAVVGLDVAEAAAVMGRSANHVRVLSHRGLRRLAGIVIGDGG